MYHSIEVEPLTGSIGAVVGGVDLRAGLRDGQAEELRRALIEHLVIFLRAQHLDDEAQGAFARVFGELRSHPVDEFLGQPEVVGTIATRAYLPGEDHFFHTDFTFVPRPPEAAVLRAVVVPPHGGDTIWASMYDAYDALSPSMQAFLEGMEAFHDQGPQFVPTITQQYGAEVGAKLLEAFPGTTQPVVIVHPESGRKVLFVNEAYTRSIVGLSGPESRALLGFLFEHVGNPRFHCRYRWSAGDLAVWDERCTQHLGEGRYWPEERVLHRVMVGSTRPRAVGDREMAAA